MNRQNNEQELSAPQMESTGKASFYSAFFRKMLKSDLFWRIFVFVVTAIAFLPSLNFKDLISDDHFYFLNVLSVQNSLWRIFDPVLNLSTPLTSLSFYLDLLVWGKEHFTTGAHLVNVMLHGGNALLFYLLLRMLKWDDQRLTPVWAGTAALIFALHPQRVESVAWICERKDCLAMFLGLGALIFFLRAMRQGKISWASGLLLLLSFLAKPMWLFFFVPAAALIWSERRSFEWRLYLKLLWLPSLIFAVFTAYYLSQSTLFEPNPGMAVPLLFKLETILYNYGNYFLRTFIPGNLFPVYPYYNPALDPRWMALIPVGLCFVPFMARQQELRSGVLYGVLPVLACFAAILIPVVGFNRVGNTDFADRYSYLPSIFLITGAAFLLKLNIPRASAFGRWLPVLGVLYCGGLLYKTEQYLPIWKGGIAMLERSLLPQVPNYNSAINSAIYYYSHKEYDKAIQICKEKMPECAHYPRHFVRLLKVFKLSMQGLILFQLNKPEEGIRYLNTIYMSDYSDMVVNFPINYAQKVFTTGAEYHLKKYNDKKGAANLYRRCSAIFKFHARVYEEFFAGMADVTEENYSEAVKHFKLACSLNPEEPRCRQNLNYAERKLKEQKK